MGERTSTAWPRLSSVLWVTWPYLRFPLCAPALGIAELLNPGRIS